MEQDDGRELRAENLAAGDPILRYMVKLPVPSLILGTGFAVLFYSIRFVAAWRAGHLFSTNSVTGFVEIPAQYLGSLASGSIIATYYIWVCKGIANLFNGLDMNHVIGPPKEDKLPYSQFVQSLQDWFARRLWSVLAILMASGLTIALVYPQYSDPTYSATVGDVADDLSLGLSTVFAVVILYLIIRLLLFSALIIYWLYRLFRDFSINVRLLHPDQAGGLSPLGNFSLTTSYLISYIGVVLVLSPISRHYAVYRTIPFAGLLRSSWPCWPMSFSPL